MGTQEGAQKARIKRACKEIGPRRCVCGLHRRISRRSAARLASTRIWSWLARENGSQIGGSEILPPRPEGHQQHSGPAHRRAGPRRLEVSLMSQFDFHSHAPTFPKVSEHASLAQAIGAAIAEPPRLDPQTTDHASALANVFACFRRRQLERTDSRTSMHLLCYPASRHFTHSRTQNQSGSVCGSPALRAATALRACLRCVYVLTLLGRSQEGWSI